MKEQKTVSTYNMVVVTQTLESSIILQIQNVNALENRLSNLKN